MIAKTHWSWPSPGNESGMPAAHLLHLPGTRQALDHLLAIQMRLELATEVPVALYGPIGQVLPGISPARARAIAPQQIKDLLAAPQWPRRIGQVMEVVYGANLHIFITPLMLKGLPAAQVVLGPVQLFEPETLSDSTGKHSPPGGITSINGVPVLPSWRVQATVEIARMIVSAICTQTATEREHPASENLAVSDRATAIMPIVSSTGPTKTAVLLGALARDATLPETRPSERLNTRALAETGQEASPEGSTEDNPALIWPPPSGPLAGDTYPATHKLEHPSLLRDLIETMPQAVIISAAPGGQVVLANRAASRLWPHLLGERAKGDTASTPLSARLTTDQYPPEWLGLSLALREDAGLFRAEISIEVAGEEPYAAFQPSPAGQVAQRSTGSLDTALRGPRQRPFLVSAFPLRSAQGVASHAVAIFEDLSGLLDRELFKDELLLLAAHDARNPLTLISSYAQLLERNLAMELPPGQGLERARGRLAEIQGQVQALTELTDRLYTITRLQSAQQRPHVETLNLARLLQRAAIDQQMLTPGRSIETAVEEDPCMVQGDPTLIQHIVMRLLKNAIRYSHPGKPVQVFLRCMPENNPLWAEVSIRDQGIGIPRASLPHIFERFYRVTDNDQRARAAGLPHAGSESTSLRLSLYLCKQLIEHMGGRIWADSVEGQGTTISFTIPLKRQ